MNCKSSVVVSVVVPTCDRPDLVRRAIESVAADESVNVVVVDNGYEAVEGAVAGLNCVKYLRTKPRIGPGRARNVGAAEGNSPYIAFLDDDDVWDADYLKHSVALLEEQNADVVVGALKRIREGSDLRPYKLFPASAEGQRAVFFRNPGFGGQNFIIKRSVFEAVSGFDEDFPASVDRDLAARLLLAGYKIAVEPKSVAILQDHEGDRVRQSQVKGNFMFLKKHWGSMRWKERYKASKTLVIRWFRYRKGRVT